MVNAFEANKAETTTMLPTIEAFMAAHRLTDVTVVADAGMVSEANRNAIEDAACPTSSARRSPRSPTWSPSGAASTPTPINTGQHTITAADPLPADIRTALEAIRARAKGH